MRVELKTKLIVPLTLEFRMTPKIGLVVFFASLLFPIRLFAGTRSGADFLKIPIGAETAGLGQATTALSQGISALNSNPAGLLSPSRFIPSSSYALGVSHQDQLSEATLDHLGLIFPQSETRWTAGLNLVRMSYGAQQKRNAQREVEGSFGASDLMLGAVLAKQLGRFKFGTQLKYIKLDLAGYQAQGLAGDFGTMISYPHSKLSFGLAVKNLGPQMKFVSEKFYLPLQISAGSALQISNPLQVSLDIISLPYQQQTAFAIGTQLSASQSVTFRAGYLAKIAQAVQNTQKDESNRGSFSHLNGIAGGFGIRLSSFFIDYSVTPFGELGMNQSLTLSSWFGGQTTPPVDLSDPVPPTVREEQSQDRPILILPTDNDPFTPSNQN